MFVSPSPCLPLTTVLFHGVFPTAASLNVVAFVSVVFLHGFASSILSRTPPPLPCALLRDTLLAANPQLEA